MEPDNPALDDFALSLTGVREPRVLFLPTASGDPAGADPGLPPALRRPRLPRRRTCRCSACTARPAHAARDHRRAGPRSTSAAARCATCWPSGGRTASTRCSIEAWERGTVLVGLSAPARCAGSRAAITKSAGPPEPIDGPRPAARAPSASTPTASPSGCRSGWRRSGPARCPAAGRPTTASACCSAGRELERIVSSRPARDRAARRRVSAASWCAAASQPELLEVSRPASRVRRRPRAARRPAPPPLVTRNQVPGPRRR